MTNPRFTSVAWGTLLLPRHASRDTAATHRRGDFSKTVTEGWRFEVPSRRRPGKARRRPPGVMTEASRPSDPIHVLDHPRTDLAQCTAFSPTPDTSRTPTSSPPRRPTSGYASSVTDRIRSSWHWRCSSPGPRRGENSFWRCERPPPFGGGLSRNPGGDLLSQGGTPKYHRRWWA